MLTWLKRFVRTHLGFAARQPKNDVNQNHDDDDVIRDITRRYISGLKKRDTIKRMGIVRK